MLQTSPAACCMKQRRIQGLVVVTAIALTQLSVTSFDVRVASGADTGIATGATVTGDLSTYITCV